MELVRVHSYYILCKNGAVHLSPSSLPRDLAILDRREMRTDVDMDSGLNIKGVVCYTNACVLYTSAYSVLNPNEIR